jgi:hypothetical protein
MRTAIDQEGRVDVQAPADVLAPGVEVRPGPVVGDGGGEEGGQPQQLRHPRRVTVLQRKLVVLLEVADGGRQFGLRHVGAAQPFGRPVGELQYATGGLAEEAGVGGVHPLQYREESLMLLDRQEPDALHRTPPPSDQ